MAMAFMSRLLVAVVLLNLGSSAPSEGADPHVSIDAKGAVLAQKGAANDHPEDSIGDGPSSWLDVIRQAKERMARTRRTVGLMRAEVRQHLFSGYSAQDLAARRQRVEETLGLLEAGEVNCTGPGENIDPVTGKLCRILVGSNSQVAGKLERAVKGLSLRPKSANDTELTVANKEEDQILSHLKAAMWDMWFCAKRANPPCDPMTTDDPKVKAARDQAFDALHAIHSHAEEKPTQATETSTGTKAEVGESTLPASLASFHPSRQEGEERPRYHPAHLQALGSESANLMQKAALSQTPTAPATEFATDTLDGILTPPNVTGKLWDAINMIDLDDQLEQDMARITDDEDGNMRKLRSNMLILHECASMPDCPAANCCKPKAPTQMVYIQARNDAYVAYHNVQHDDDMAKKAYIDLLKNIGNGPGGHKTTTQKFKAAAAKGDQPMTTTTIYPPGHPLHGSENKGNGTSNETVSTPPPPVQEGGTLLISIIIVTVVVVGAIGFLVFKTHQMEQEASNGGAKGAFGGEGYGGEGGGDGYGGY